MELVTEILGDISSLKVKDDSAAELSRILQEPHFQVKKGLVGGEAVPRISTSPERFKFKGRSKARCSVLPQNTLNINMKFHPLPELL